MEVVEKLLSSVGEDVLWARVVLLFPSRHVCPLPFWSIDPSLYCVYSATHPSPVAVPCPHWRKWQQVYCMHHMNRVNMSRLISARRPFACHTARTISRFIAVGVAMPCRARARCIFLGQLPFNLIFPVRSFPSMGSHTPLFPSMISFLHCVLPSFLPAFFLCLSYQFCIFSILRFFPCLYILPAPLAHHKHLTRLLNERQVVSLAPPGSLPKKHRNTTNSTRGQRGP